MSFTPIEQNFEDLKTGNYPSDWKKDGSSDQQVVDSTSYRGSQCLELGGSHGGCWQAIANAPLGELPRADQIRIAGAIKPAVNGTIGCHNDFYGGVFLRTAVGSWNAGSNRKLFELNSDGISGFELELGTYTEGEWLSYEILYKYNPENEKVTVVFEFDGENRGRTTVDATDFEGDLSYITFKSGDFTGYWDSIEVDKTTSSTETPAQNSTAKSSTNSQRKKGASVPYDIEEADRQTEVKPIDRTLLVLRDIPDTDGRPAVTTLEYELVDTDTARDALVTYTHGLSGTGFDWQEELSYAKSMEEKHRAAELWNRAASIGWDALAAYAMAQINPTAAIGPVLETLQDSTTWVLSEATTPYEEAMSKQSQWTYTYRTIQADIEAAESLTQMSGTMYNLLDTANTLYDTVDDLADVVSAAQTVYSASNSFTTAATAGATVASSVVYYTAIGTLVSEGIDTITSGMEQNAKLSAIGHAYSLTRIPVIERIIELEEQRKNNLLSPCGAWELAYLTMNHHYMGAFANQGMFEHAHAIEQSTLGGVWDTLVNVAEVASVLRDRASSYQWGGAAAHYDYGDRMQQALDMTANSVNLEVLDTPTKLEGSV